MFVQPLCCKLKKLKTMNYEDINLKEATIIDVRTPGEFSMGNVQGSAG